MLSPTAMVLGSSIRRSTLKPLATLPKEAKADAIKAKSKQKSVRKVPLPAPPKRTKAPGGKAAGGKAPPTKAPPTKAPPAKSG